MNSQQELLDAIKAISENADKSYDTPATVLRIDGDTVWVHIDGGADETPVRKTINCEEGETVQVRISNGSAFLVGNASAPPTDDKTANVAHFVAEQADEKATEAINSVNAIVQTVQGKVDSGDSNITDISSTMYQNANGVNIYNDTLAVGDSYAHIDGNSFDIKEATSAGVIDDVNDEIVASFGSTSYIQSDDSIIVGRKHRLTMTSKGIKISTIDEAPPIAESGWEITASDIKQYGDIYSNYQVSIDADQGEVKVISSNYAMDPEAIILEIGGAQFITNDGLGGLIVTQIDEGDIKLTGDVYDYDDGYKKTPTVLTSTTISSATTSYTFSDASIKADSVIDIYDTIFGFAPTGMTVSNGSCVVTFPAQSSSHTIKLFVY